MTCRLVKQKKFKAHKYIYSPIGHQTERNKRQKRNWLKTYGE